MVYGTDEWRSFYEGSWQKIFLGQCQQDMGCSDPVIRCWHIEGPYLELLFRSFMGVLDW